MARLARVVVPGLAHHVTQRGNGRQQVFFSERDYALYLRLITEACTAASVSCLAFCLMPNHVHLILTPATSHGLRHCLSATHRAYAGILNARRRRTGHFWQGRYGSVPMDDAHLYEALRYVLMNPVRAKLVTGATSWKWSSARAYVLGKADGLTSCHQMLDQIPDMRAFLCDVPDAERLVRLRAAETIGRPAAAADFTRELESKMHRVLVAGRRGPKPQKGKHEEFTAIMVQHAQLNALSP